VQEFTEEGKDIPSSQGLLITGGTAVAVTTGTLKSIIERQTRWTEDDLKRLGLL
jgi:hypothetical protein